MAGATCTHRPARIHHRLPGPHPGQCKMSSAAQRVDCLGFPWFALRDGVRRPCHRACRGVPRALPGLDASRPPALPFLIGNPGTLVSERGLLGGRFLSVPFVRYETPTGGAGGGREKKGSRLSDGGGAARRGIGGGMSRQKEKGGRRACHPVVARAGRQPGKCMQGTAARARIGGSRCRCEHPPSP
jgi:hypothetical protein